MNARTLLDLCRLSYVDLPHLYIEILSRGGKVPVAAFADAFLRMYRAGVLECISPDAGDLQAAERMRVDPGMIFGYMNRNGESGFAAFLIEYDDANVAAMRGSEGGACGVGYEDWADNFCEPFASSIQTADILELMDMLPRGKDVIFTGHSKGGHNAMLALALTDRADARAVAFNGQGFGINALTDHQRAVLSQRAVNYVVASDVVGALLSHPEKRIFVKQAEGSRAHYPEAFVFRDDGSPVKALRTPISMGVEAVTRGIDVGLPEWARRGIKGVCKIGLGQ